MLDDRKALKSFEVSGEWFRWSRYRMVNKVIVPMPGAELNEYDPWKAYRSNAGKYRTVDQPYTSLLELQRKLEEADSRRVHLYYPMVPRHSHRAYRRPNVVQGNKLNEAQALV